MTSIQQLSFLQIGMSIFSDSGNPPTVGPYFLWENDGSDEAVKREVASTFKSYFLKAMAAKVEQIPCRAYSGILQVTW
jgi:hypothetical protein